MVRLVLQVFADVLLFYLDGSIAEHGFDESFRQNIIHPVSLDLNVLFFGIDAQRDVGRQRPWSSRPCEKIGILFVRRLEFDENSGFLYVFIALRHFVRR